MSCRVGIFVILRSAATPWDGNAACTNLFFLFFKHHTRAEYVQAQCIL